MSTGILLAWSAAMPLNAVSLVSVHGARADGSRGSEIIGLLAAGGSKAAATPLSPAALRDGVGAQGSIAELARKAREEGTP